MLNTFTIASNEYQQTKPYPHFFQDNILDAEFAQALQEEILKIPPNAFDRYENPFEHKWTLRNKHSCPPNLEKLFTFLESDSFVYQTLSPWVGFALIKDPTRHFNGVHLYQHNDKLDIHVDAGIHPSNGLKKQVTLGIYLSKNWKKHYGCDLEIWTGDNAAHPTPKLLNCKTRIAPLFNRLVLFTCDDYSWHGNPEPANCPEDAKRIFITVSYLSYNNNFENRRQKAYFIARPQDPPDSEKDKLRELRAHPEKYKQVYRI